MPALRFGPYVVLGDATSLPFGMRYRVEHRVLGTHHDLEVVSDDAMHDEHTVRAFVAAARARAAIGHRNVCAVRDSGRLRDGRWYAVADALDGPTLAQHLAARGPLGRRAILEIVAQIANGQGAIRAAASGGGGTGTITADRIRIVAQAGNPLHVVLEWSPAPPHGIADVRALALLVTTLAHGAPTDDVDDARDGTWVPLLRAAIDGAAGAPPTARGFALALAEALPDGLELVRRCARELFDTGDLVSTMRASARDRPRLRFTRDERIGEGGMGEVWRGTISGQHGFARPVALKYVHAALADHPVFARRFIDEARIAARLVHPNIVAVLDFDRDLEGRLVLAMEHVDGPSLDAVLATGPIPPAIAAHIIVELLRGLAHAHALQVIHRDVSPHNVLVSRGGAIKVSDFGLARVRDAAGTPSTRALGKPPYRSPDHVAGAPIDERSDLFCAGIVAWEMLAGRALFVGSEREILVQIATTQIPRPRRYRAEVPEALEAIVMRMLEREAAARPATADAVIAAIIASRCLPPDGRGDLVSFLARRAGPATEATRPRRGSRTVVAHRRSRPAARSWWLVVLAGALVGATVGVLATL